MMVRESAGGIGRFESFFAKMHCILEVSLMGWGFWRRDRNKSFAFPAMCMQNHYRGQGAIEFNDASFNCRHLAGQGATEYLVLLAVVLIVALVSVALLGFFPGMASDAQITQSQAYWQSAQPISILEGAGRFRNSNGLNYLYVRFRNMGAYPIRITGIVGGDGSRATTFYGGDSCGAPAAYVNISEYYYLGPGEEKYFGRPSMLALFVIGDSLQLQAAQQRGLSAEPLHCAKIPLPRPACCSSTRWGSSTLPILTGRP